MKTFFKKFRASMALDQDAQPTKQNEPAETRAIEEPLRAMDSRLRASRVGDDVPSGLHGSIMRAVRNSTKESEPVLLAVLWPRLAVVTIVLALGVGVFWSLNRVPVKVAEAVSSTEAAPSLVAVIEQGHVLTQAAPEAVLGPLSGEWELLNNDIQKAVNFVVASVP